MKKLIELLAKLIKNSLMGTLNLINKLKWLIILAVLLGGTGYGVYKYPPFQYIANNEVAIRVNKITGDVTEWQTGRALVLPYIYEFKKFNLTDRIYQPQDISRIGSSESLQSLEGLSVGANLVIRYKLDSEQLIKTYSSIPEDPETLVQPAVYGIVYKVFAKYTVREIFSSKREDIRSTIETELKPLLAADGLVLTSVQIGSIDLPDDYRRGMDALLAEELASEKMRYTLELKKKQLEAKDMEAKAEKERREVAAQASAREEVIAAQAQEEAMKHIIPFKQKQIEQRKLEAEANSTARIQEAQGNAKARLIEASGEADARRKLAEADAYRIEQIGKANVEQMAKEGELITKHPALIQKAMADKLSDKVQVIIAPPSTSSGFIGDALLGNNKN